MPATKKQLKRASKIAAKKRKPKLLFDGEEYTITEISKNYRIDITIVLN